MGRPDHRHDEQAASDRRAPAPTLPPGGGLSMATAMGNQAFGALLRQATSAPRPSGRGLGAPADHATTARLARAVLARDNGHGDGSGGGSGPGTAVAAGAGSWSPPMGLEPASTQAEAAYRCAELALEAAEMIERGFEEEFRVLLDEAQTRREQFRNGGDTPLTATEVQQLTDFGDEFDDAHRSALREIASHVSAQLRTWRRQPLSEEEQFELREAVHDQFISGDESRIAQLAELMEKVEELTGKVDDWVGYGSNAISLMRQAERLQQIQEAIEGIHNRIEEVQQMISLARDIGRLAGVLGDGPAGVDDISRLEGGLGVLDFVVGRFEVPGITQLWNGYILEAAQAALRGVRHVLDSLYRTERGREIRLFFEQNLRRRTAPPIEQSLARYGNLDRHFPGGQPVFDFMWRVMRDDATDVPDSVENYFLRYRDEFNAGMGRGNQIESDSSVWNAWNLFTREESPNLLRWVLDNRQEIWTRLYGGMPTPG